MDFGKWDFKNIDWLSPKPSKERVVVGAAILLAIVGGYVLASGSSGTPPSSSMTAQNAAAPGGAPGTANPQNSSNSQGWRALAPGSDNDGRGYAQNQDGAQGQGPVPLQALGQGQCRTFAPAGWRITDANPQGTIFTLSSPDGSMMASYAGTAANSAQVSGVYGDQYRTPENLALYFVSALTNEQAQWTGPEQPVGPYSALTFTSASHSGYVLLYKFQVPADPGGFGIITRIAIGSANDPRSVGVAGAVAAASRCQAVVVPGRGSDFTPSSGVPDHDTGSVAGDDDSTLAGTYNAQLGTGWVHDDAGNNYNVDVTSDYHETGPDGPGYYKQNGNDLIKLTPGLE
jgi:hypothetical protein